MSNEDGNKHEEASSKDSPTEEKAGRKASCEYCDKEFSSRKNLRQHIRRIHFKIIEKCPVCDKYFDKEYLKKHIRTVHKDGNVKVESKYVQCDFCLKRIVKWHMKRHKAFHRRVFIKALCV